MVIVKWSTFLLLFLFSFNSISIAKDNLKFLDKYEDENIKKEKEREKRNAYLECVITNIKPESTDAHVSVVKDYCKNKVYKN